MTGILQKKEEGWVVKYVGYKIFSGKWVVNELPIHPDYVKYYFLDEDAEDGEVEFEIVDYSQKCKECGESVERGHNCKKGCFMKSGNFVFTDKLEYAKLIKTK